MIYEIDLEDKTRFVLLVEADSEENAVEDAAELISNYPADSLWFRAVDIDSDIDVNKVRERKRVTPGASYWSGGPTGDWVEAE